MMIVNARAENFDVEAQIWDVAERTYNYRGANRKRAMTWALHKIEKEFPNRRYYQAEITE